MSQCASTEEEEVDYTKDIDDPLTVTWIREELTRGNGWAWFCAKVTVSYNGLSSEQYLGCCSYKSEADFKKCANYEQMVDEGVEEIAEQLEALMNDHDLWEHDGSNCLWCVVS